MNKTTELKLDITDKIDAIKHAIYKENILDQYYSTEELIYIDTEINSILSILDIEVL